MSGYRGKGKSEGEKGGEEKMKAMEKGIVVVVLAAALLVSTVGISSANSITWDLDALIKTETVDVVYIIGNSEIEGKFEDVTVYQMNKQDVAKEEGSVTVGSSEAALWRARNTALCDVPFSEATWQGQLNFETEDMAEHFESEDGSVCIGIWNDSSSSFYVAGCAPEDGGLFAVGTSVLLFYMAEIGEFTVPEGDWLAFLVYNGGDYNVTLDISGTYITYPFDDPAYPVPEPPTVVLTSVGLLALAGYVGLRRKR